ncbi:MAG: hypothetical protein ACKVHR_01475 [Pirellulales bacterium]
MPPRRYVVHSRPMASADLTYTQHVFHVRTQNAVGVIAVDDWLAGDFMDVASFSACVGVKKS